MRNDSSKPERVRIPLATANDYTHEMAERRRDFVRTQTGAELVHMAQYTFDPELLPGNVESFLGVAQVPVGVAGPLRIMGEHAQGDFFVPLATTEGTLVASYGRGMRLIDECGGVRTTLIKTAIQRAPVFLFDDARSARGFARWSDENFSAIKEAAERTTTVGKLHEIESFVAGPNVYLRFHYSTGDVAGQNVTTKATATACQWIQEHHPGKPEYYLSGGMEGEKRHAQINTLHTRGRRVVAEAVLKSEPTLRLLGVTTQQLARARQVQEVGHVMSGSAHGGANAASGLSALFIATGQDVANLAESHAGLVFTRLLDNGDLYWSLTLPSLVIGTYGGGTSLPTQREALAMLGCYGKDKANKFAEICAGLALCGELSASAVLVSGEAPMADKYARNRP